MFGLPDGVKACLFDMDGVVTQTAVVHAAAWKEMFDEFLRARAESTGTEFVPFDAHHEYDAYVDGKPRLDGTSREPHVPVHWNATSNVLWRTKLPGLGHASPVVWEDRLFTVTAMADLPLAGLV